MNSNWLKMHLCFTLLALRFLPQALVVEIEANQTKLDECQTHSKQYCISVKVRTRFPKQRFYLNAVMSSMMKCTMSFFLTVSPSALCVFAGLRAAVDDLPSLRGVHPQVLRQEEADALLLGRHFPGGEARGKRTPRHY